MPEQLTTSDISREAQDIYKAHNDAVMYRDSARTRAEQAQSEEEAAKADMSIEEWEVYRKAHLWDSHESLQTNREAYEKSAVKDATAAGHSVDFAGEHFPAKTLESDEPW